MKMLLAIIFFVSIFFIKTAYADNAIYENTKNLYQSCEVALEAHKKFQNSFCAGYIEGVFTGYDAGGLQILSAVDGGIEQMRVLQRSKNIRNICLPNDIKIDYFYIAENFVLWMKGKNKIDSDQNSRPAYESFFRFLTETYPCKN